MRDSVLWRKETNIVMLLSKRLNITPERALDVYFHTRVNKYMSSSEYGLQQMSDLYIVDDIINEEFIGNYAFHPVTLEKSLVRAHD